ncbi:MAG: tetratricopeptide repeat protein [Verrucomicrobia bacterium]|nr:tetratricopeptide repeat protein [Verrucomicrobiota bacterium]
MRPVSISWAPIFLSAVLLCVPPAHAGASNTVDAPAQSPGVDPGTNMVSSVTVGEFARAIGSLQAEWKATRESVEGLRRRAELDSRQTQERMSEQLARLEKRLDSQHEDRDQILRAMELSSAQSTRLASMFVVVGLLALFAMSFFQWRAMLRLSQLATRFPSERLELAPGAAPSSEQRVAATKETTRLIESLERLEHRIEDFETVVSHQGEEAMKAGSLPAPPASPAVSVSEHPPLPRQLSPGFSAETPGQSDSSPVEPLIVKSEPAPGMTQAPRGSSVGGLLGKGEALLQLGQAQDALSAFEQLLGQEPNHVEAWVKKGSALERLEQIEQALACYDRAISIDRSFTLAYLYKGGICNRLERFDEALSCYEQALRSHETAAAS